MTGNNPSPWPAATLALLSEPVVSMFYEVRIWDGTFGGNRALAPAYNVQVTLDATNVPYGEATFSTAPLGPEFDMDISEPWWRIVPVEILAGYSRSELQTLMFGYVTSLTIRKSGEGKHYLEWTVQTADTLWEFPSHKTYSVSGSYTLVSQVITSLNASNRLYLDPVLTNGTLNTPSGPQLTSFRACALEIGDTIGDYLRQLGQTLGQRVRPDWRATTLRLRNDVEPTVDTANPYVIPHIIEQSDTYGASGGLILNLSAEWYQSGDKKTYSRVLDVSGGSFPTTPDNGNARPLIADATVYTKPPGGVIPNDPTWGPVARWAYRINANVAQFSVTARAAFWLQPFDAVKFVDANGYLERTIGITRIAFDLEQGTMTLEGSI